MPPKGLPPQSNAANNIDKPAVPYYSNEDIYLLHQIVIEAQRLLPTEYLPTNALFSAYKSILPLFQVDPNHDSRYARVLFKIGGLRGAGTLFEKFEQVMSRMGIELELDQTENEQALGALENLHSNIQIASNEEYLPDRRSRVSRRNSESSVWDLGVGTKISSQKRSNSICSTRQARTEMEDIKEVSNDERDQNREPTVVSTENTLQRNVGAWLATGPPRFRKSRDPFSSTQAGMQTQHGTQIQEDSAPLIHIQPTQQASVPVSVDYHSISETTAPTSPIGEAITDSFTESLHPHSVALESENLMNIKACLIFNRRLALFTKSQLQNWKDQALQLRQDNAGLDIIAYHQFKKTVLPVVLHNWRVERQARKTTAETEIYFDPIERRAKRARDRYLLYTAFLNWSIFARQKLQRTILARRYIIRYRKFNAWRDITAVNELKVRRQVLKRFFAVWRRRHDFISSKNLLAFERFDENLVKRYYLDWLHKLWAIKAFAWGAKTKKCATLCRWIDAYEKSWRNDYTADLTNQYQLLTKTWQLWRAGVIKTSEQDQEAESYYQNRIFRGAFFKWCKETDVIPAKNRLQADVTARQLRSTYSIWLYRAREARRAVILDRTKILREACANWRLKARAEVMSAQINIRAADQAIYQWIMAARASLANRVRKEKHVRAALVIWKSKCQVLKEYRWDQEALADATLVKKMQNNTLKHWYSRMGSLQHCEVLATSVDHRRLLQGIMLTWKDCGQHNHQLQKRSRDAGYYILVSKFLKRWNFSTESARRAKRKLAYTRIRRMVRINLARASIQNWQSQARRALEAEYQAIEMSHDRIMMVSMAIIHRWRSRSEELAILNKLVLEKFLNQYIVIWRHRLITLKILDKEAMITYQEKRLNRALKTWNLQALHVGARTSYASDITEKTAKRHFRKIFSYWHQQAMQKRWAQQTTPLGLKAESESVEGHDVGHSLGTGPDIWDRQADLHAVSTPVPGYLNTPSKQSERFIAVAARYSTPRAPLSTFSQRLQFSSRLRPRLHTPLLPAHSSTSAGTRFAGFADIPEKSPILNVSDAPH